MSIALKEAIKKYEAGEPYSSEELAYYEDAIGHETKEQLAHWLAAGRLSLDRQERCLTNQRIRYITEMVTIPNYEEMRKPWVDGLRFLEAGGLPELTVRGCCYIPTVDLAMLVKQDALNSCKTEIAHYDRLIAEAVQSNRESSARDAVRRGRIRRGRQYAAA